MAASDRLVPNHRCGPWLRVQSSDSPLNGQLITACDQVGQSKAAIERPTMWINRAKSDCFLDSLDGRTRSVTKRVRPSTNVPGMRRIGVERESPFNRAQAGSTLAGQVENAPTAHLQRLGIFPSCLDSPPRKPSCPTLPDGRCRKTAGGASEAKSTRVSRSFRSPLNSRSM